MSFKDILNEYIEKINCSSKELSNVSNISESVISRYRSGERTPKENSEQINKLINAIYELANNKNIKIDKKEIEEKLNKSITKENNFDYDSFSKNFNELINILKININDISKFIAFDSSHISRIRYGKARPSDPIAFSKKVCEYIGYKYTDNDSKKKLCIILNCEEKEVFDELYKFLTNNSKNSKNYINDFLNNLDDFNLNDFIKAIKFDKLKVPTIPFYKTKSKHYYGIEGMKKGEIDFFKNTIFSKENNDIFMCSDMPMEDMAEDINFGKKWMFMIAMSLKKGLHLNIIHNLDRPFNEMMLGLESWIPIYMTGQVSPYYLKDVKNNIYNHLNYVSGTCALEGECIKGFHNKGKYYLTTNNKEISYYKEKSNLLLKKANSLMDIYTIDNKNSYNIFLNNDYKTHSDRKRYLSSLPLFTMSNSLLKKILKRNNLNDNEIKEIIEYKKNEEKIITELLNKNVITDNIYIETKDDFINNEIYLSLENLFTDKKIKYEYNEYLEHLKELKIFKNKNYKVTYIENRTFKNITITILEKNFVLISKNANPIVHFVIKHPKLIDAINNFNPIVKE